MCVRILQRHHNKRSQIEFLNMKRLQTQDEAALAQKIWFINKSHRGEDQRSNRINATNPIMWNCQKEARDKKVSVLSVYTDSSLGMKSGTHTHTHTWLCCTLDNHTAADTHPFIFLLSLFQITLQLSHTTLYIFYTSLFLYFHTSHTLHFHFVHFVPISLKIKS